MRDPKGGEDCYDELPRTIIADVTRLLNTAEREGPIRAEDLPALEAEITRLRKLHDDATADELAFVESYTASVFRMIVERARSPVSLSGPEVRGGGESAPIEDDPFDLAEQEGSRIICAAVAEARAAPLSEERLADVRDELRAVLPPSSLRWNLEHLDHMLRATSRDQRFDAILARVAAAFEAGQLTKELFIIAYDEARAALGDGIEREALEAITNYADGPAWEDEAERAWLASR